MTKIIAISILCFSSFAAFSQIKKGAVLIGADISFNSNSNSQESLNYINNNKSNNFNFSVQAGKAVKDNLFVGGSFSMYTGKNTGSNSGGPDIEQKFESFGAAVWLRKYYPVYGPLYGFVNSSIGASINDENRTGFTSKMKGFGMAVNLYPGISFQVKKSFYFDAALTNLANIYYNHSSSEQVDVNGNTIKYSSNNYGVSTSLGNSNNPLQLGIRWIIQK